MINLLVYDLSIFSGNLVNDKFSNLKLNIFCSDKYGKQVVLINYSWISPTLQELEIGVLFILQKTGECTFPSKKEQAGKIMEGFLGRVTCLLLILVFINKKTLQSKLYTRVTNFK